MAKPDTDDGWIKMAHELDAALAFADFTKAQRIVLHYAFAQMFQHGVNHRVVSLAPAAIAESLGLDRSNASHAIAALVADGVLVKTALCRYAFSKNYEAWRRGNGPRFKPAEIAAIKAAPERASMIRKCSNPLSGQTTPVVQSDNAAVVQSDNGVVQSDNETLSNQTTKSASPHTPLYGRKKEEQSDSQTGGSGEVTDSGSERYRKATDPERERKVDALTTIFDAAVAEFGDPGAKWVTSYGHELRGDPALWVRAIKEAADAVRAGATVRSLGGFIRFKHEAICRGGDEVPVAAKPKPTHDYDFIVPSSTKPRLWNRRPAS